MKPMSKDAPSMRSAIMRQVRDRNTAPERAIRGLLGRMGYGGYKLNQQEIPGKPDFVWPKKMLAVFVHGCFWHGHNCVRGARMPKSNRTYWRTKIDRNRKRDTRNRAALRASGWRVLTIWECELKDRRKVSARLGRFFIRKAVRVPSAPPR